MTPAGANKSTAPDGAAPEASLQADIDSLLEDIDATADRVQQSAAPASSNLNTLLSEPTPPPHPSPEALEALDNLDAQLAELTAELLTPPGNTPAPEQPSAPVEPSPRTALPPAAPVDAAPVVSAPAPKQPIAAPAPSPAKPDIAAVPAAPGPVFRLFESLSRPLQSKPPVVRTLVGLFAVNTVLLAAAVWAYLILRPPPAPTLGQPFDLSTGTLPRPVEPDAEPPKSAAATEGHAQPKAATGKPAGKTKPASDRH